MILYHGTDQQSANNIISNINVKLGGGELGMGFYAGTSIALAASINIGKGGVNNTRVVELNINDHQLIKLTIRILKKADIVYGHWQQLRRLKTIKTYTFGFDVVVGPFATINFSHQYKFESSNAEAVLNNYTYKRIL